MTPVTDPLLHAWLLAIATEPPESWYADSRLALADWLEECGDGRAAAVRDEPEVAIARKRTVSGLCEERLRGGLSTVQFGWLMAAAHAGSPKIDWTLGSTSRERQRLLALFPEVTLAGPCPRHEPLPKGVTVTLMLRNQLDHIALPAGCCLWCGDRPRTAPAPEFLLHAAALVRVEPGVSSSWGVGSSNPHGRNWWVSVTVPVGGSPLQVPGDMIKAAANVLGEPL